jgi:adenine/guanine phosphoribosyltransferase-like PRPP-binding protein
MGRLIGARSLGKGKRVLFLDDFVSMGDTRDRILDAIEGEGGEYIGTYQYKDDNYERRRA